MTQSKDTNCSHEAYTIVYGAKRCAEPDCLKYLGEASATEAKATEATFDLQRMAANTRLLRLHCEGRDYKRDKTPLPEGDILWLILADIEAVQREIERLTKERNDLQAAYLLAKDAAESLLGMRSIDPSDVERM